MIYDLHLFQTFNVRHEGFLFYNPRKVQIICVTSLSSSPWLVVAKIWCLLRVEVTMLVLGFQKVV